jgi:hypothetical protein
MFLFRKIKYRLSSMRNTPSDFFMEASASPFQKSMMDVMAAAQPTTSGIINLILACLYSFDMMKTLITSEERVESESEYVYNGKKCGSTDIMNTPDPKPQSDWINEATKHVKAKSAMSNNSHYPQAYFMTLLLLFSISCLYSLRNFDV